jgi:hypothetical protein
MCAVLKEFMNLEKQIKPKRCPELFVQTFRLLYVPTHQLFLRLFVFTYVPMAT